MRDGRTGSGGCDIDLVDGLTSEVVGAQQPPQRFRRRGAVTPTRTPRGIPYPGDGARVEPGGASVLGVDGVHAGQGHQQHPDAEGHGGGRDGQPHGCLSSPVERQAQTETDHDSTGSADIEVALPSRTTISRSAYAATLGSWVTTTTVVPCWRAAATNRFMTCSPLSAASTAAGEPGGLVLAGGSYVLPMRASPETLVTRSREQCEGA